MWREPSSSAQRTAFSHSGPSGTCQTPRPSTGIWLSSASTRAVMATPSVSGSEQLVQQLVVGARLGQELPAGPEGRGERRDVVLIRRGERARDHLADQRLDLVERLGRRGALADPRVEVDGA